MTSKHFHELLRFLSTAAESWGRTSRTIVLTACVIWLPATAVLVVVGHVSIGTSLWAAFAGTGVGVGIGHRSIRR